MSELYEIADAVKTRLNGASLGFANAERLYIPLVDLAEMASDALRVTVLIGDCPITVLSRDEQLEEVTIHVAILQKFPASVDSTIAADNALIDPLLAIYRKLRLFYHSGDLAADAQWFNSTGSPTVYERDRMRKLRTFFAVISYTFQQAP